MEQQSDKEKKGISHIVYIILIIAVNVLTFSLSYSDTTMDLNELLRKHTTDTISSDTTAEDDGKSLEELLREYKLQTSSDTTAVGDTISFHGIDWRVLETDGDKALLLSTNILGLMPYHNQETGVTWEKSSIREYLNGRFLDTFSEEDRARILETKVVNADNAEYGTDGGNDTMDKVFLLSIDEVNWYFTSDDARIAYNQDGQARWWWLRSPGRNSDVAATVRRDGSVYDTDFHLIFSDDAIVTGGNDHGVRPALWVQL
jgi:hypothetical protein